MRILRYFISIVFCGVSWWGQAQEDNTVKIDSKQVVKEAEIEDTKASKSNFTYNLTLGADITKLIRQSIEPGYKGTELVASLRISNTLYLSSEFGIESKYNKETLFSFTSSGDYFKIGLDKNFYHRKLDLENLVYFGFRIGNANFSQQLHDYKIFLKNQYWDEGNIQGDDPRILTKNDNLSISWFEIVFGIKVKLIQNIYMGASLRFNTLISDNNTNPFPNQWAPSFNIIVNQNNFSGSYNYTITYQIPLMHHHKIFKKK